MWNILVGASGALTILYLLGPQGFGADGQTIPPSTFVSLWAAFLWWEPLLSLQMNRS